VARFVALPSPLEAVLLAGLAIVTGVLAAVVPWYIAIALLVSPFGLALMWRWPERVLWLYMVLLPFSNGVFVLTIRQQELPVWREAMLAAVAGGMALRIYWRRRAFSRGMLPLALFLAFFVMMFASGWDSDSSQYRAGARALLPSILVLLAAAAIDVNTQTARRILLSIFWIGVIESVIGIGLALLPIDRLLDLGFEYAVQVREVGIFLRAFGTFRDPFGFAHFTMICLIACWASRRTLRQALPPSMLYGGIGVLAAGVVMSFVRDGLLGTAVGIAVCQLARGRFTWPVIGMSGLAALAMGALALAPAGDDLEVLRWDTAVETRLEVWSDLLVELGDYPLGRGLGTVGAAAERALEDQGATTREYDAEGQYILFYDPVDSQYVLLLTTGGVLSFIMFWVAIGFLVGWLRRHVSSLDSPWTETLTVSLLGIVFSLLAVGTTRNILEEYPTGVIFWLAVGLLIATVRTALDAQAARRHAPESEAGSPTTDGQATAEMPGEALPADPGTAAPVGGLPVASSRARSGWR
jgi:hypothetical protein